MVYLKDASKLKDSWKLSYGFTNSLIIANFILKEFKTQDFLVVDFLYQSYSKSIRGVILNEDEDFNTGLQVAAFLGAINKLHKKYSVLILCSDDAIYKWHYFMSNYGGFGVKIIKSNDSISTSDSDMALLLSFSNIKLAENFTEDTFLSVVIDNLDVVATKLVIRKLQGIFNIGLSSRNFYIEPDQKLQWNMLNWANPGCVGKLADFYQLDSENFANLRDNYKEWWFRITWSFCDSFVKPSREELKKYETLLEDWIKKYFPDENPRKRKPRAPRVKKNNNECKKTKFDTVKNSHSSDNKVTHANPSKTKTVTLQSNLDDPQPTSSENFFKENECLVPTGIERSTCENNDSNNPKNNPNSKGTLDDTQPSISAKENLIEDDDYSLSEQLLGKKNKPSPKCWNEVNDTVDESEFFLRSIVSDNNFSLSSRPHNEDFFKRILNEDTTVSNLDDALKKCPVMVNNCDGTNLEENENSSKSEKVSTNTFSFDIDDLIEDIYKENSNKPEKMPKNSLDIDDLVEDIYKLVKKCD